MLCGYYQSHTTRKLLTKCNIIILLREERVNIILESYIYLRSPLAGPQNLNFLSARNQELLPHSFPKQMSPLAHSLLSPFMMSFGRKFEWVFIHCSLVGIGSERDCKPPSNSRANGKPQKGINREHVSTMYFEFLSYKIWKHAQMHILIV